MIKPPWAKGALLLILFWAICNGIGAQSISWNWLNGSENPTRFPTHGIQNVPGGFNTPGRIFNGQTWTAKNGDLWLFGGYGSGADTRSREGWLNDLWKFDGVNWTWISGSKEINKPGVYGTQNQPDSTSRPGGRSYGCTWVDSAGNFWLYGGTGYDADSNLGNLSDLWMYDGTDWTWVSGTKGVYEKGVYGPKGSFDSNYTPGVRSEALSWSDKEGNFYLFGGVAYDVSGTRGGSNQIWKFNGKEWAWIHGDSTANPTPHRVKIGAASKYNRPGWMANPTGAVDALGNFWLFGGYGLDKNGEKTGFLQDLWKFDGTNWTHVKGKLLVDQPGVFGAKGVSGSSYIPACRNKMTSWIDPGGNFHRLWWVQLYLWRIAIWYTQ